MGNNKGQTLLEVLMVAGVMALLMVMLVSLSTTSITRNRESGKKTVATQLAQQGMEWLRAEENRVGWIQIWSNSQDFTDGSMCLIDASGERITDVQDSKCILGTESDQVDDVEGNYYRTISFVEVVSAPNPTYLEAVVEVTWDGNDQNPVRLETDMYED